MSDGLFTLHSRKSVPETIDRLAELVTSKGMTVFARIDHAANARQVSMELRPTELLVFGHPRGGTPLMQARQTIGIDLPIHALAWEDASGSVRVTFNDPAWLARRHGLPEETNAAVQAMSEGIAALQKALSG